MGDLPPTIHPVVERFVTARLLVSGGDGEQRTVEVAHEALFRSWGRLARWLNQSADELRLRRDIQFSARSWDVGGRDAGDLWRGARLARAFELVDDGHVPWTRSTGSSSRRRSKPNAPSWRKRSSGAGEGCDWRWGWQRVH